ncbi:protoporphyrinogen oxidase HemJ [Gynuella sunshinyii]|uniref:Protoporphyrinogen IX oxidase n=1 Tax=Gynuella sunshinyii YC6258 TaxID=1445510 RepID=A0A0C5VTU7_9GAMM|nr:protoporphyrinogen oxidase HemJ [Gynuella sunshinyii]AJQ97616.1 putative membrane protein [Gynuella sunshinyii YC6258]
MLYLWIKALHIIAVVTWMAGIFYLPRLFVYHAMTDDEAGRERFKIMERKLYRGIMVPSEIAVLILGVWLLWLNPGWLSQGWLHAKLLLVVLLIGYQHWLSYLMKQFRADRNTKSDKFYRVINELPVFILIGTVILVVVKPF